MTSQKNNSKIIMNDDELASIIQKHRKNLNLSQIECGRKLNISRSTLSSIEINHRNFNLDIGLNLAKLLEIDMSEFTKRIKKTSFLQDTYPEVFMELSHKNSFINITSTIPQQLTCQYCNYEYTETPLKRTQRHQKHCQTCNSIGYNYPEVMNFWDYENNKKTPLEVSLTGNYSCALKCPVCSHSFLKITEKIMYRGLSCPECIPNLLTQSSRSEKRLLFELQSIFDLHYQKVIQGFKVDFYIPKYNIIIEYDGGHHKKIINKDIVRYGKLNKNHIVIACRVKKLDFIPGIINIEVNEILKFSDIESILLTIQKLCISDYHNKIDTYIQNKKFAAQDKYQTLLASLPKPDYKNSLKYVFDTQSHCEGIEFDFEGNYPLRPENISKYSRHPIFCICDVGHIYPTRPEAITYKRGCKTCFEKKIPKLKNSLKKYEEENQLNLYFSKSLNEQSNRVIHKHAKKKYFFICRKEGHTNFFKVSTVTLLNIQCKQCQK